MVRVPTHREPTHPGEMLLEEFLVPMKVSQRELADAIHVPYQRINELVNGRRGVTPSTALRLARVLDTSPGYWLNLQTRWDLYHAQRSEEARWQRSRRSSRPADSRAYQGLAQSVTSTIGAARARPAQGVTIPIQRVD